MSPLHGQRPGHRPVARLKLYRVGGMDPVAALVLGASALGAIGLLRRGTTPLSEAGRAVTRAGFSAVTPVLSAAQHLPRPLRPVTSTLVRVSAATITSQAALVVDGAATLVEAASASTRHATAPGSSAGASPRRGNVQQTQGRKSTPPEIEQTVTKNRVSGGSRKSAAQGRAGTTMKGSTSSGTSRASKRKTATKKSTAS